MYWTYAQLKDKVRLDLDIQDESPETAIIGPEEMLAYTNEAVDRAFQEVSTLYEDYFLTRATLTLVSGQEGYDIISFITDMYANKIRRLTYSNGSKVIKVDRIRDWHKFEEYALDQLNGSDSLISYFIINGGPIVDLGGGNYSGGPQILFTPTPRESGPFVTVWYIRRPTTLSLGTDFLDIPEANNYILQYVKVRCLDKLKDPSIQKAVLDLEVEKSNLVTTLASMVPDADNEVEADYSNYQEMS